MIVKRIVPNLVVSDLARAKTFYKDVLGLELAMDLGWIATMASSAAAQPQVNLTSESTGGDVPALSVEVDDLDEVLQRAHAHGVVIEYGPKIEEWGVRRFYIRDPFGRLLNILAHIDEPVEQ